jgi:hypothetical protein
MLKGCRDRPQIIGYRRVDVKVPSKAEWECVRRLRCVLACGGGRLTVRAQGRKGANFRAVAAELRERRKLAALRKVQPQLPGDLTSRVSMALGGAA